MMFKDANSEEIEIAMNAAWSAFHVYRKLPLTKRAEFMKAIAVELENCGDT